MDCLRDLHDAKLFHAVAGPIVLYESAYGEVDAEDAVGLDVGISQPREGDLGPLRGGLTLYAMSKVNPARALKQPFEPEESHRDVGMAAIGLHPLSSRPQVGLKVGRAVGRVPMRAMSGFVLYVIPAMADRVVYVT